MDIINTISLECNRRLKLNFDGGELSSDAGCLLLREFLSKLGFDKLIFRQFKTTDSASYRFHTDSQNLMQMIFQICCGYFTDDCADELTNDPVLTAALGKDALASQPTISRFFGRMDETTLKQFCQITRQMRQRVYALRKPELLLLDLDSTLLDTYGKQEGESFNYHYQSHGYHPLVCYDGMTGDLLKIELRDGNVYSSNGVVEFLQPLLYCKRGKMENYIKESKNGFDFSAVSSRSKLVNANRLQLHALAYNLFNWFKRLVLPVQMRKQTVDTIRMRLLKIAARAVHSAGYVTFKLCSSCPYKAEFYEALRCIQQLTPMPN